MATVYIETSIPSYYFETRRTPQIVAWREATQRWWRVERPNYELVTSRIAIEELERIPTAKRSRCLRLMENVRVLPDPPKLGETVATYVARLLMPRSPLADALHLAMASLHGVSWKFLTAPSATSHRFLKGIGG